MNYELFLQGPSVYVPIVLISLVFTAIGYAVFPISFARLRKKPIRRLKYNLICYGVNLLVKGIFAAIGAGGSFSPYALWTFIFVMNGESTLRKKELLIDKKNEQYFSENKQTAPIVVAPVKDTEKEERVSTELIQECPTTLIENKDSEKVKAQICAAPEERSSEQPPQKQSLSWETQEQRVYGTYNIYASDLTIDTDVQAPTVATAASQGVAEKTQPISEIRFCRKCGFELVRGSNFCSRCGLPIKRENK